MQEPEILRQESVTKMITDFRDPNLPLINSGFMAGQTVQGDTFQWDIKKRSGKVGPFNTRTGSATPRDLEVYGVKNAVMATTFAEKSIKATALRNLRNPGTEQLQRIAEDEVGRTTKANAFELDREDELMIAGCLQGTTTIKVQNGNKLFSHVIDYGLAASHKPTPANWDNPATDISSTIQTYKTLIGEESGFDAMFAVTSPEVLAKLKLNTGLRDFWKGTNAGVQMLQTGRIEKLEGLTWIIDDKSYLDDDGVTLKRFIDTKKVVFYPAVDSEWYEFVKGSYVAPGETGQLPLKEVFGRFAWSKIDDNPPRIIQRYGEVRLPVLYVPNAIVAATVLP
jgi:hypothetical protein